MEQVREEQREISKLASEQEHLEVSQLLSTWETSLEEVFELQQEWEAKLKKTEVQHEAERRAFESTKAQEIHALKARIAELENRSPPPAPPPPAPPPPTPPQPPPVAEVAVSNSSVQSVPLPPVTPASRRKSLSIRSVIDGSLLLKLQNVRQARVCCAHSSAFQRLPACRSAPLTGAERLREDACRAARPQNACAVDSQRL